MKYLLYFWLFLHACVINAHSIDSFHFSSYSFAEGLNDSTILDITQDQQKFLWLRSSEALYRFDGVNFLLIDEQFGLDKNITIDALHSDAQGNVWLIAEHYLFMLTPEQNRFNKVATFPSLVRSSSIPQAFIHEARDGTLYFSYANHLAIKAPTQPEIVFTSLDVKTVQTIISYEGDIIIGSADGLYRMQDDGNGITNILLDPTTPSSITTMAVFENKLYVGTQNAGMYVLDNTLDVVAHWQQAPQQLSSNRITALSVVDDALWIGYFADGIDVLQNSAVATRLRYEFSDPHSLGSNAINTIYQIHNGDIFVGTSRGGLSHQRAYTRGMYHLKHQLTESSPLSGNDVTAIAADKYLRGWMAAYSDGITVYNPIKREGITITPELAGIKVNDIAIDQQSAWVLNENGITQIDVDRLELTRTFNTANSNLVANDAVKMLNLSEELALITHRNFGVSLFDKTTQNFTNFQASNSSLNTNKIFTAVLQEDIVWLVSSDFMHAYDLRNRTFTNIPHSNGVSFKSVNHIYAGPQDHLIISTEQGVYLFNPLNRVMTNDGFPEFVKNTNIQATMVTPDNEFWSTTKQGMLQYRQNQNTYTWLTEDDGLQGNYFNTGVAYLNSRGALVFAGLNGITVISPQHYVKPEPELVLSRINLNFTDNTKASYLNTQTELNPNNKAISSIELYFGDTAFVHHNNTQIILSHNGNRSILDDFNFILSPLAGLNQISFQLNRAFDNEFTSDVILTFHNPVPFYADNELLVVSFIALIILLLLGFKTQTNRIRKQRAELENLVKERTLELNKQKNIAQEQANKLSHTIKEKNHIFETLSYELRTPLTLILGPITQLRQYENWSEEIKQSLDIVARNTKKMSFLINKIFELSLSKQLGQHVRQETYCDLALALNSQVDTFAPLAKHKNIEVSVPKFEPLDVPATLYEVQSIISNVFLNALQYTPPNGSVEIVVEVNSHLIKVHIKDNGIGIEKSKIPHIFERFYRTEQAKNISPDGAGLGLFMVGEMLKRIDADITVESEIDKGSCFTLSFPNVKQQHYIPVYEKQADKPRIIVIDDNPEILEYVELAMCKSFNVTCLSTGKDLALIAQEIEPDLIITDIMMPEIDGITLTKQLKQDPVLSHIPVILLSAKTDHNDIVEGLQLEAADYIRKPFNNEELRLKALNILTTRRQLQQSRQIALRSPESVQNHEKDTSEFLQNLYSLLEVHYTESDFSVKDLAEKMAMSERQLLRRTKSEIGLSANEFMRNFRLSKAKELLLAGKTISYVAYDTGFTSPSYFSTSFKKLYGETPKAFIQNHSMRI